MSESKPDTAMSRRNFLKILGAGAVLAIPVAYDKIKKTVVDAVKDPNTAKVAVETAIGFINKIKDRKENPSFRPLSELIQDGINAYEKKTDGKAVFQRSSTFGQDSQTYKSKLEEIKGRILPPTDMEEFLIRSLSKEAQ